MKSQSEKKTKFEKESMNSETFPEKIDALSLRTMQSNAQIDLWKTICPTHFTWNFHIGLIFVIVCFRKLLGEGGGIVKYWIFWGRELETSRYEGFSEYMKFVYYS